MLAMLSATCLLLRSACSPETKTSDLSVHRVVRHCEQVRKELDRLLKQKIENPDMPFGESAQFIEAVVSLLSNPY